MSLSDNPSETFGTALKQFRKRRHLTQQQLAEDLGLHRNTIGRWEEGSFLPESKTLILELARVLHLTASEARHLLDASFLAPTPVWSVPYPRNPFFTGRENLLATLHAHLAPEQPVASPQSYALHGMGGVGKTQLALEYAYRYALAYRAVFWIGAETLEQIHASLLHIAQRLDLPERLEADQQHMVAAVQRWLESHSEWLLIWDNVEDLDLLQRFLPSQRQGAMLLTTRQQALGTLAYGIGLAPMEEEEGMLFLLRRARIVESTATIEQVRELAVSRPEDFVAAQDLVTTLGGLPLALDQAGAYLEETHGRLAEYVALFQQVPFRLLQERGVHTEHPASVVATFTLAFERLQAQHAAAAHLLMACCSLAPEEIPESLFLRHAMLFPSELQRTLVEPFAFQEMVKKLLAYALIHRQPERQTLVVHRLVQAVLRERMGREAQGEWRKRMLGILNAAFPEVTYNTWDECEHLLPHVLACAAALPDQEADWEILVEVLRKAADYLRAHAHHEQAEPLYQRALHLIEQTAELGHLSVARLFHSLATSHRIQGKYEQAEIFGKRALSIREQALGPMHPDVATSLTMLANLYSDQGKYEQAELMYQRVLYIREKAQGTEHPHLASSLNNLAILYTEQGKYEQAEAMNQRALSIRERALGSDHPDVAISLNNLAFLYTEQSKYEQAESMYQRAQQIWEKTLGPEHPDLSIAFNNLALLYTEQSKYEQAESMYQRALQIKEKALGAEHPDLGETLNGLASLCQKQGKDEQAEALYQRALSIREQHLGLDHPETAQTFADLAGFRHKQGNIYEAMIFAERALKIRFQALGDAHPKTARSRAHVAQLRQELKRVACLALLPPSFLDSASGASSTP